MSKMVAKNQEDFWGFSLFFDKIMLKNKIVLLDHPNRGLSYKLLVQKCYVIIFSVWHKIERKFLVWLVIRAHFQTSND
jgi:hypothetical protein